MLGFEISERTVARYRRAIRRRGDPSQSWLTFLHNHREVIVARDFFTVPTITFQLLYGLFVIEHGRRRILHFNVTAHPTGDWVMQQLREAFPASGRYRYVILDHDSKFDGEVIELLESTGLRVKRTSIQAPWQNGTAERWVGSCRREVLDHVIALDERHLRRLIREYVAYHNEDRIHDALAKDTPNRRHESTARRAPPISESRSCRQCTVRRTASSLLVADRRVNSCNSSILLPFQRIAIAERRRALLKEQFGPEPQLYGK